MLEKDRPIDKEFLLAAATLIGTAIGAGTFGLPYMAAKIGFIPMMAMIFLLGALTLVSNLMYGEISLRTKEKCRLIGYAHKYLGDHGRRFAAFISFLSLYAGNLVYIILGGVFLNSLFSGVLGGNEFIYGTAIFIFVSIATYFNLNFFSIIESWMVLLLLLVMGAVVFRSAPYINFNNYYTAGNLSQLFLPFGMILFSLSASTAIPELEYIVTKKQSRIKEIISLGTIVYTCVYMVFIAAILGVTGSATSEESFMGLSHFIGDGVITSGFILGFLAVVTSYLVSAIGLREMFCCDYKINKNLAWFLASFPPFLFFILGFRDFIEIISFAGSITGGFVGILIILIFYNAKTKGEQKPAFEINISKEISFLMIVIFLLGIICEIFYDL